MSQHVKGVSGVSKNGKGDPGVGARDAEERRGKMPECVRPGWPSKGLCLSLCVRKEAHTKLHVLQCTMDELVRLLWVLKFRI